MPQSGIQNVSGVITDNRGHVYLGDQSKGLFQLTLTSPPALAFGLTAVGATSAPKTETFYNYGNAALTTTSIAPWSPSIRTSTLSSG